MQILRILAFLFLGAGFLMVFLARRIVERYDLDRNLKCEFADEMSEEEVAQYKFNKALLNFKMLGMLVALPGIVLIMIFFR